MMIVQLSLNVVQTFPGKNLVVSSKQIASRSLENDLEIRLLKMFVQMSLVTFFSTNAWYTVTIIDLFNR